MKVQLQRENYQLRKQNNIQPQESKNTSFKGVSGVLNYFATNQGIGACATDLGFMVIPRTANEIPRGADSTAEAAFRESLGTTNHACIGMYGLAGGALLGTTLASNYGVKATQIFTSPERVEALAELWSEHLLDKTSQKEYLASVVEKISGYNTTKGENSTFVKIAEADKKQIVDILDEVINDEKIDIKKWKKSNTRGVVSALITESTGAETRMLLEKGGESSVQILLDDIVGMTKAFKQEKVMKAFEEFNACAPVGAKNPFLKAMSKFNKGRALIGFLVGSGIGVSVQPINMWITKKRTGKTGFVGSSDGSCKDTSTKFLLERIGVGAAMGAMVLATLKCKPQEFLTKMAFKGKVPTLDQLKGIYGTTIIGRVAVTRNEDELRESATKDVCGFLSWLVLGDFVNRGVAYGLSGKSLLNFNKNIDENIFTGSKLKSRSEVLREALRSVGISTIVDDAKTGLKRAMNINEMIDVLKNNPAAKSIAKATRGKLTALNWAQAAGYAFTGLALGVGIPMLNIRMTRRAEIKRQRKAEQKEIQEQQLAKQDVVKQESYKAEKISA